MLECHWAALRLSARSGGDGGVDKQPAAAQADDGHADRGVHVGEGQVLRLLEGPQPVPLDLRRDALDGCCTLPAGLTGTRRLFAIPAGATDALTADHLSMLTVSSTCMPSQDKCSRGAKGEHGSTAGPRTHLIAYRLPHKVWPDREWEPCNVPSHPSNAPLRMQPQRH